MLRMRYPWQLQSTHSFVDALPLQLHTTSQVTSWSKTATVNKLRIHHVIPVQNTGKSLGYLDHFYLREPPPRNFQILNPKLKVGISWNNIHVFPFHRERGTEGYPRRSKTLNPKLQNFTVQVECNTNARWLQVKFRLHKITSFSAICLSKTIPQFQAVFETTTLDLYNPNQGSPQFPTVLSGLRWTRIR